MALLSFLTGCGTVNRAIYPVPSPSYSGNQAGLISLKTSDGVRIAARHLQRPDNEIAIVYSHGNGEDLGHAWSYHEALHAMGVDVLAYDYRGYGRSEGRPSEKGTYRDIEAAVRRARGSGKRIVLIGRSLGSGPSVDYARRNQVDGLVLISAYTDIFSAGGAGWLPGSPYQNLSKIDRVNCPVIFVHGDADQVIPFHHSQRLLAKAREPKKLFQLQGRGHNDILLHQYRHKLREFLDDL